MAGVLIRQSFKGPLSQSPIVNRITITFLMGNVDSTPQAGWRVLKVMPGSPLTGQGLVPYFDVLTHINGTPLLNNNESIQLIKDGVQTQLTVLNYVTKKSRALTVVPNSRWGGEGLLGLIIRYDQYENADEDTIHVLDVHPGSPAQRAGLQAHSDYLLGTAKLAFKGYDQLDYFLERNQGQEAALFVFNAKTNRVREVLITPDSKWGGKGSLGCELGFGYLHRLPITPELEVMMDSSVAATRAAPVAALTATAAAQPQQAQVTSVAAPVANPVISSVAAPNPLAQPQVQSLSQPPAAPGPAPQAPSPPLTATPPLQQSAGPRPALPSVAPSAAPTASVSEARQPIVAVSAPGLSVSASSPVPLALSSPVAVSLSSPATSTPNTTLASPGAGAGGVPPYPNPSSAFPGPMPSFSSPYGHGQAGPAPYPPTAGGFHFGSSPMPFAFNQAQSAPQAQAQPPFQPHAQLGAYPQFGQFGQPQAFQPFQPQHPQPWTAHSQQASSPPPVHAHSHGSPYGGHGHSH